MGIKREKGSWKHGLYFCYEFLCLLTVKLLISLVFNGMIFTKLL